MQFGGSLVATDIISRILALRNTVIECSGRTCLQCADMKTAKFMCLVSVDEKRIALSHHIVEPACHSGREQGNRHIALLRSLNLKTESVKLKQVYLQTGSVILGAVISAVEQIRSLQGSVFENNLIDFIFSCVCELRISFNHDENHLHPAVQTHVKRRGNSRQLHGQSGRTVNQVFIADVGLVFRTIPVRAIRDDGFHIFLTSPESNIRCIRIGCIQRGVIRRIAISYIKRRV